MSIFKLALKTIIYQPKKLNYFKIKIKANNTNSFKV